MQSKGSVTELDVVMSALEMGLDVRVTLVSGDPVVSVDDVVDVVLLLVVPRRHLPAEHTPSSPVSVVMHAIPSSTRPTASQEAPKQRPSVHGSSCTLQGAPPSPKPVHCRRSAVVPSAATVVVAIVAA